MASRDIQRIQDALENDGIDITPEEIEVTLEEGPGESKFPLFLFLVNLLYDALEVVLVFFDISIISLILCVIFLTIPIWIANFIYMWGKIGFIRKKSIRWFFVLLLGSLIPIIRSVFPQCLFVFIAWKHESKFVERFYEIIDATKEAIDHPERFIRRAGDAAITRMRRG